MHIIKSSQCTIAQKIMTLELHQEIHTCTHVCKPHHKIMMGPEMKYCLSYYLSYRSAFICTYRICKTHTYRLKTPHHIGGFLPMQAPLSGSPRRAAKGHREDSLCCVPSCRMW